MAKFKKGDRVVTNKAATAFKFSAARDKVSCKKYLLGREFEGIVYRVLEYDIYVTFDDMFNIYVVCEDDLELAP